MGQSNGVKRAEFYARNVFAAEYLLDGGLLEGVVGDD